MGKLTRGFDKCYFVSYLSMAFGSPTFKNEQIVKEICRRKLMMPSTLHSVAAAICFNSIRLKSFTSHSMNIKNITAWRDPQRVFLLIMWDLKKPTRKTLSLKIELKERTERINLCYQKHYSLSGFQENV